MIKSVASLTLHVSDPERSEKFYRELGFLESKPSQEGREVRLNWFRIRLVPMKKLGGPGFTRGAGIHICVSVDDLDDLRKKLKKLGLEPSVHEKDLLVSDPDGYQLLFFQGTVAG